MIPLAHGIGQSTDLPLPLDLVLQAGAATVVISFLGAALLWRRPRLAGGVERHPRTTWWRRPLQILVLAVCVYLPADALLGPRDESNPAAHALYVWLWVGLIPLSVLFGPVWRAVNPLRTIARLLRRPVRAAPGGQPWAAAAGLLAFAWLELIAPDRADPLVLGLCLLGYAVVQVGLIFRYGADWPARGDLFEVYSDLAGRLSPLRWRPPLSGLAADHPAGAGRAAFLAIWWGSTIFDSAAGSPAWAGFVQRAGAPVLWSTLGLVLICGVVFVAVRTLPGKLDVTNSLIPIAVGYTLAHYLTLLLVEGPRGGLLLVQQWGLAEGATWNVLPDPHVISVLQVALILLGHALGVLAAHDLALADSPGRPPLAVLADELPVVLFMIACTWTGLFLLFVR
ncbi:hypothetical protein ODJ79_20810 [Actinoplanes sp. KI2]|uniref:hypothetical protein n=1 Tax=Actinoplanes sp. KI2 TaxID=2983315 RepID=UPI0021D56EBF|nr:hypothetical protein [Actinoplanes sp. KI2]MCU7726175.1 hypothetical protein [Actinoplanes sp. KI2]